MKLKTKKRLRAMLAPARFVWASVAVIIATVGALLMAGGYWMLDGKEQAKEIINRVF